MEMLRSMLKMISSLLGRDMKAVKLGKGLMLANDSKTTVPRSCSHSTVSFHCDFRLRSFYKLKKNTVNQSPEIHQPQPAPVYYICSNNYIYLFERW